MRERRVRAKGKKGTKGREVAEPGRVLHSGDNLGVLRDRIATEAVDLVYLDPPFNSKRDYNVLFAEHDAGESEAQIRAFEDYWKWDRAAERTFRELTEPGAEERGVPSKLIALMEALRSSLGQSDMMAYLVMMAIRLVELHRVLKPTGSLFLHCDPTASHYLKLVLDAIFGTQNFVNEVVWKRSDAHSDARQGATHLGRIHDVILFYAKTTKATFNTLYTPLPQATIDKWYRHVEPRTGRRYNLADITGPGGASKGNPHYEFLGVTRYWRYSRQTMDRLRREGRIVQTNPGTVPMQKRYLDESKGVSLQDLWTDIEMLRGVRKGERLGYPTQKPLALLERIIEMASNKGDVVLDPFCGCGTTIHAAERLKRRWIGIDITHLAIALIRNRLETAFPGIHYEVRGIPADAEGARALAEADPYQFQWWALHLIGARPVGTTEPEGKKGKDRGIDGVIRFRDDPKATRSQSVIVSVKAGKNLTPAMVRDLRGTIEREGAPIGVFLSMYEPTAEMRAEAAKAGTWRSETWNREYPRIQLITVEEAFKGKRIEYPGRDVTLQAAQVEAMRDETPLLPFTAGRSTKVRRVAEEGPAVGEEE